MKSDVLTLRWLVVSNRQECLDLLSAGTQQEGVCVVWKTPALPDG